MLYEKDQIVKILTFFCDSRDPDATTLFHVANVDSGEIRWIHGVEGVEMTEIFSEHRKIVIKPFDHLNWLALLQPSYRN